jgi:hypothetical protein
VRRGFRVPAQARASQEDGGTVDKIARESAAPSHALEKWRGRASLGSLAPRGEKARVGPGRIMGQGNQTPGVQHLGSGHPPSLLPNTPQKSGARFHCHSFGDPHLRCGELKEPTKHATSLFFILSSFSLMKHHHGDAQAWHND